MFFNRLRRPVIRLKTADRIAAQKQKDLRHQYAQFCVSILGDASVYQNRANDFDALCAIPGVAQVGINWTKHCLFVGTGCVDALDGEGEVREIGHLITTFAPREKKFRFENVTRMVSNCPHPHISSDGTMCISDGKEEIMFAMIDCVFSKAMRIIMPVLRMDRRIVNLGHPYSFIESWPLKSGVRR
jgi:hypothetical protein